MKPPGTVEAKEFAASAPTPRRLDDRLCDMASGRERKRDFVRGAFSMKPYWIFVFPALAGACVVATPGFSQTTADEALGEAVVVTASRLGGIRTDLLGSSATVLEPLDLQLRQTEIVSDVLRDVPGVAVNRAGPVGQLTQVRIRGAEGNHTLVMIDGIKASDPFFGEFDWATLIADDVVRVEVLRGEQSALYGSDAIGGVVQYITATGADAPGLRARAEGGSFGTADGAVRAAGVVGNLDYALSGAYYHSDGTTDSAAGTRKLRSDVGSLTGKFGYALSENLHINAVIRYSSLRADNNQQDFNSPPGPTYGFEVDGNGHFNNTALYGLLGAEFDGLDGRWKNAVTVQGVDAERDGFGGDFTPPEARSSGDKGRRLKASYVSSLVSAAATGRRS
jgi:vitamin B12 transporter